MIIDFHTHAFNPKIAERATAKLEQMSGIKPYTRGSTNALIDRFDEWGIDKGVVLPIATKPTQQTVINDWLAEIGKENKRIIPFGSVHPDAEDAEEEVMRIKSLGLYGIKLHPDQQNFMADDPKLDSLYDTIAKSGLPLILHAGFDFASPELIHCPPERALNLIKHHPDLKVVFAHLGGNECWDDVYNLLAGVDGEVYFDTAYTLNCPDELMKKIIDRHGVDRILLGSDCPWESTQKIIEKILRLGLSDIDRKKIFGENAQRLLNLS